MAGEWDISTYSTSLGLTDTQIKTHFSPSAQIFHNIAFLKSFFNVKSFFSWQYIFRVRLHRFSNQFLRWNSEIVLVVFNTMKPTFWVETNDKIGSFN